MRIKKWENLPPEFQIEEIKPYYELLRKKQVSLFFKRVFDIVVSFILLSIFLPIFILLAIAIKIDSRGPVFFRQTRVTQYGKEFRIFKFRTMVQDAEKKGAQVTQKGDARITRVGKLIRKCRLDEVSQLIDVFRGKMTFVGTRPEVPKYVDGYQKEMLATLLLPAGITSETSIYFKDEDELMAGAENPDEKYLNDVLPIKMKYNLQAIKKFGFFHDIKVMFMTVFAVLGKEYKPKDVDNGENQKG